MITNTQAAANHVITYNKKQLNDMLINCSIDAIIAVDLSGNIIEWNAIAEKIYGKNKQTVLNKYLLEVILSMQEDDETLLAIDFAYKGVKCFVPASKKYDHRKHTENHFIPLKDDNNVLIGVMNLVHNVAHRIKAEEQLQYLNDQLILKNKELEQRNAELVSLSNVASNDLREPLRKIYTASEAIITFEARNFSDSGKAHLRRIQSAAQKMGLITDDLLLFTAITKSENAVGYVTVNMNEVLNDTKMKMQRLLEDKNVAIEADRLPDIYGSYDLLIQLFQNIINNSVKFQPRDNKPLIKISASEVRKEDRSYTMLSFKDNGIGFNIKKAEDIFNLFTKLDTNEKFSGSGVGLAVCKKIMEQHNGYIEANSTEGLGTEICCYFP